MVTRYFNDEVHEFRRDRFNGRGHGYPLSHDRDLSSGPNQGPYGGHIRASIDGRNGQSPEVESNSSLPRRRIPVAVSCPAPFPLRPHFIQPAYRDIESNADSTVVWPLQKEKDPL